MVGCIQSNDNVKPTDKCNSIQAVAIGRHSSLKTRREKDKKLTNMVTAMVSGQANLNVNFLYLIL